MTRGSPGLRWPSALAMACALMVGAPACVHSSGGNPGEPSFPVEVTGGDEASFTPAPTGPAVEDSVTYDAVVIGAGPAGLMTTVYLSDANKRVLLLEKEPRIGGLASRGRTDDGLRYARGAAYWSVGYEEEEKLLERIGLLEASKALKIPEPTDAYLWNGRLHVGVWNASTLAGLPAGFALFKEELERLGDEGQIPDQPIEESPLLALDSVTAADWIRGLPARAAARTGAGASAVYRRYLAERVAGPADGMAEVLEFMDLYCRSSLGAPCGEVSAVAFVNFYVGEMEPRCSSVYGTGEITDRVEAILMARPQWVTVKVSSPVARVADTPEGVSVTYVSGGTTHLARARYAVYAASLKLAPRLIDGLERMAPDKAAIISKLTASHVAVHQVRVRGHPYRAAYDTWLRPGDTRQDDPTDVVLGRWVDPAIHGFEGTRDFAREPADDKGSLVLYHTLPAARVGTGFTREQAAALAREDVRRLIGMSAPLLRPGQGTRIEVTSVETIRWPFALTVVKPGHLSKDSRVLRRPLGHIFFASSGIGVPGVEEAMFRGHCAADNVLGRLDPHFTREPWSRCPMEP